MEVKWMVCNNCMYYANPGDYNGECRYNPPPFIITCNDAWCGKFKSNSIPKPPNEEVEEIVPTTIK